MARRPLTHSPARAHAAASAMWVVNFANGRRSASFPRGPNIANVVEHNLGAWDSSRRFGRYAIFPLPTPPPTPRRFGRLATPFFWPWVLAGLVAAWRRSNFLTLRLCGVG